MKDFVFVIIILLLEGVIVMIFFNLLILILDVMIIDVVLFLMLKMIILLKFVIVVIFKFLLFVCMKKKRIFVFNIYFEIWLMLKINWVINLDGFINILSMFLLDEGFWMIYFVFFWFML